MSKYGNIKQIRKSWHFNVQHVIIRDHFCSFTICYEPKIVENFRKLTKVELNLASNASVGEFQTFLPKKIKVLHWQKFLVIYEICAGRIYWPKTSRILCFRKAEFQHEIALAIWLRQNFLEFHLSGQEILRSLKQSQHCPCCIVYAA